MWERFGVPLVVYLSYLKKDISTPESNFCRSHPHSAFSRFLANEPEIDWQRVLVPTALLHVKLGNFFKDILKRQAFPDV